MAAETACLLLKWSRRDAGAVTVESFANFSTALYGSKKKQQGVVDYSQQTLSLSSDERQQVTLRPDVGCLANVAVSRHMTPVSTCTQIALACLEVGTHLEEALGCPQDIEGAFVGKDLFIVQTRPF